MSQANMSWKRVIIFSIITAVITAVLNVIPALSDTSFQDIAINLDKLSPHTRDFSRELGEDRC